MIDRGSLESVFTITFEIEDRLLRQLLARNNKQTSVGGRGQLRWVPGVLGVALQAREQVGHSLKLKALLQPNRVLQEF